ncbi:hypothetical protein BH160DRAFT_0258 [Burkholderia sp. H160]|nr:hypothetical protein BH160DRAFT_0258 [Burkholderia sp. H160]
MYFALLVSRLPQVREPHHYYVAPSARAPQAPIKPSQRWWVAIRAVLRPAARHV